MIGSAGDSSPVDLKEGVYPYRGYEMGAGAAVSMRLFFKNLSGITWWREIDCN